MTVHRPSDAPVGGRMSVLMGVWLLGRGRARGLRCFAEGSQAVLSALAPTIAFAIIGCVLSFALPAREIAMGLTRALVPLVCTLIELVVSEFYARWLGKDALWTQYAAACLWCGWLPLVLMLVVQAVLGAVLPAQAESVVSLAGVAVGIECYSLWLGWFVARVGLRMTAGVAAGLIALQAVATSLVLFVIWVLPPHYNVLVDMLGGNF